MNIVVDFKDDTKYFKDATSYFYNDRSELVILTSSLCNYHIPVANVRGIVVTKGESRDVNETSKEER